MVERAKVTVEPTAAHPDVLDVQDAMRQVLDFFELLSGDQDKQTLVWNLVFASTNSPFTAEGEAVSLKPDVDITVVARAEKALVAESLEALSQGRRPARRLGKQREETAKRLFRRNLNGVGRTQVALGPQVPTITVTPAVAKVAIDTLEAATTNLDLLPRWREREEIGSIEGALIDVGTDYHQPAIRVLERKSGKEVWCRVDPSLRESIAREASFLDVWENRRVIVRGRVRFDEHGQIIRVHARSIETISPREMTVHDIRDTQFTNGMNTAEYIERLREGELGD